MIAAQQVSVYVFLCNDKKCEILVLHLDKIDNSVRKNMRKWVKWDLFGVYRKEPFEDII